MAVKINGTIVADLNSSGDSVDFVNITDATGTYDNLRAFTPNIGDVGGPANDTLDFNFSSCSESMTANHTYTEANKSAGRVLLLSLNRNPSGTAYTPAFSANIKWPNDTEPTWGDYDNWLICLVCWDSTTVRATASGFGGTNNYPAGTFTVRERLITDTGFSVFGQSSDSSIQLDDVEASSDFNFSVVRTATGARIDIQEICDSADYWNLSDSSVSFSGTITAWEDTSGATVTDCRIDIDGVAGAWISLPSTGSLRSENFSVSADVAGENGPDSNSDSLAGRVKIWLRSSQYTDTAVAEFSFGLLASAANGGA